MKTVKVARHKNFITIVYNLESYKRTIGKLVRDYNFENYPMCSIGNDMYVTSNKYKLN